MWRRRRDVSRCSGFPRQHDTVDEENFKVLSVVYSQIYVYSLQTGKGKRLYSKQEATAAERLVGMKICIYQINTFDMETGSYVDHY